MGPVSFLTPLAALVALVGFAPLAFLVERERRGRRVRRALGLADPPPGPGRAMLAALTAIALLAGIAAAQPVIARAKPLAARTDAEIFFALDTSRSMLAAAGPSEATRFDRARAAAIAVRARLREVPAGIAQFTDWTVPHLFPTIDAATFRTTLAKSVGVGSLGSQRTGAIATDLTTLAAFAQDNYFSPGIRKRLLVVLTDGESARIKPRLAALRRAGIRAIFVHVWGPNESIWRPEGAEPQYRADPMSARTLAAAATLVDGAAFDEHDIGGVIARAESDLGRGPTLPREQRDLLALMPYATLAAIVPLAAILRRRNL